MYPAVSLTRKRALDCDCDDDLISGIAGHVALAKTLRFPRQVVYTIRQTSELGLYVPEKALKTYLSPQLIYHGRL